jgi:hypothetical protein
MAKPQPNVHYFYNDKKTKEKWTKYVAWMCIKIAFLCAY